MSKKLTKLVLAIFMLTGVGLSINYSLNGDIGGFLIGCGSVLMFGLLYRHPEAVMVSKLEEVDEHIMKFKRIDYLLLVAAIGSGLVGLILKGFQ